MNKITILAQAVGILALITAVISFQQRDIKKLILCQLLSNITFGIHFAMIGAYTGSVLNIISALRAVVFYFKGKKAWASLPVWPWIFIGLFAVSTAFTWINCYNPAFNEAPWGGYKKSGIGRDLGVQGLEEYQEIKQININLNPGIVGWYEH